MNSSYKALLWGGQFLVVIVLLIWTQLTQPLTLNADLSAIFATEQRSELKEITAKIEEKATRSQIMLIGAKNKEVAISEADKLVTYLLSLAVIENAQAKFQQLPDLSQMIIENQPYKHLLLSNNFEQLLMNGIEKLDGAQNSLFAYQFTLLNQMADIAVSQSVQHDPTLSFADYFSRSFIASSGLTPYKNYLIAEYQNKHYVFVSFSTLNSGINIDASQTLVKNLQQVIATNSDVEYLYTGAVFYASEASSNGQFEMLLYGTLSLLATLVLMVFTYRNFIALFSTLMLIAISFIYGYLALDLLYVEVNVLALVFSVTLIGISADYSFHALTELKFGEFDKHFPLNDIFPSLIMSYITTAAGYSILLLSPFVLFQQIAIFTICGLFGALTTVLFLYPILYPFIQDKKAQTPKPINAIHLWHKKLSNYLNYKPYFIFLFTGLSLIFLFFTHFNDDIRSFYAVSEQIKLNENKVKHILKQKWDLQYILIKGETCETVLLKEEKVLNEIAPLLLNDELTGISAVSQWMPSISKQQKNQRLVEQAQALGLFTQIQQLLPEADWRVNQTQDYLTADIWFNTILGKLFQQQWLQANDHYYSVIRLAGIRDLSALNLKLANMENVFLIDKAQDISEQITVFRTQLIMILIAALLIALLVFKFRYGTKIACMGVFIPFIALILALCISFILQQELNIFNLVSCILILALGLDYSVFYAEHGFEKKITLTTLMSALSSTFVFAILMFSSMPAIKSFGMTVFIGVLIIFTLSPQITKINNNKNR